MIRHIVMFNLKSEVDAADRDWLFGQMHSLGKLAGVKSLTVGKLLDARESWYKERINPEFGWALLAEFENEDALYSYQKDPKHVEVAAEIRKRVTGTRVVDFVSAG
jgi:hypothetical protein